MENISATNTTEVPTRRFGGYSATTLAAFVTVLAAGLWSGWATDKLLDLQKREVVTVELSTIMDDFVEAEARSGRSPEDMKRRVELYLAAIQASVETLGREGRTVLVAEAVVAGGMRARQSVPPPPSCQQDRSIPPLARTWAISSGANEIAVQYE